uniref:Uncharacterized protein n=1 Tax=Leersia perrieri TaxID=77586 RepID=A0A0D9WXI0_9ORYZ
MSRVVQVSSPHYTGFSWQKSQKCRCLPNNSPSEQLTLNVRPMRSSKHRGSLRKQELRMNDDKRSLKKQELDHSVKNKRVLMRA